MDSKSLQRLSIPEIQQRRTKEIWNTRYIYIFNITQYLKDRYLSSARKIIRAVETGQVFVLLSEQKRSELLNDFIVKEFIKFQHHSHQDFFAKFREEVKKHAENQGHEVPIFGNQYIGVNDHILGVFQPAAILLSNYFDIIQIETPPPLPPRLRLSSLYKIGLAMAEYKKPLWVQGSFHEKPPENPKINLLKINLAEGFANGGIRELVLGGWPGEREGYGKYVVEGEVSEEMCDYTDYIDENRDLFSETRPLSRVAIIYSIPTFMWHNYPNFLISSEDHRRSLVGYARALEEAHIPYDVVIFGHPEFYNDTYMLERLINYDCVILPQVECITQDQVSSLRNYLEQGGGLILAGDAAKKDEDYNSIDTPEYLDLSVGDKRVYGSGGVIQIPGELSINYHIKIIEEGEKDPASKRALIKAVEYAMEEDPQIETNADEKVYFNVLTQPDKYGRILIHLLNYNYDFNEDSMKTYKDINIKIRLPTDFRLGTVKIASPDIETKNLNYKEQDNVLEIRVPELKICARAQP